MRRLETETILRTRHFIFLHRELVTGQPCGRVSKGLPDFPQQLLAFVEGV